MTTTAGPRCDHLSHLGEGFADDASSRGADDCVGQRLLGACHLRQRRSDAGASGLDFLRARAGAKAFGRLFRGAGAALARPEALTRHVSPRRRIVSLLA